MCYNACFHTIEYEKKKSQEYIFFSYILLYFNNIKLKAVYWFEKLIIFNYYC